MSRVILLDPSHWAGKWAAPDEDQHYDLKTVNKLAYEYGAEPDSSEKEAKLLQLLECFHGYLMKYVLMIKWGTIPPANSRAGKDAKELLRQLAPRGSKPSKELTDASCKMLHLAFKGQSPEEIYDTLAFCFMRAARNYDPFYSDKTRKACEEIHGLPKQFTPAQLDERVDFDSTRILRALVRKEFLASITDKKKVVGYTTTGPKWPPPAKFFQSGPVGFVYMLQKWFRYYVNEYIVKYFCRDEVEEVREVFFHELRKTDSLSLKSFAPFVGRMLLNPGHLRINTVHSSASHDTLQRMISGFCPNEHNRYLNSTTISQVCQRYPTLERI